MGFEENENPSNRVRVRSYVLSSSSGVGSEEYEDPSS